MKISPLLFISALLLTGVIGFFTGRSFPAKEKIAITPSEKVIAKKVSHEKTDEVTPVVEKVKEEKADKKETSDPVAVTETETNETNTDVATATVEPEKKREDLTTLPLNVDNNNRILKPVKMGISDKKISEVLRGIAESLERKKLAYVSSLSQDCSGIFHQIKDSLQTRLAALRASKEYHYPLYNKDRSSRQIADWYYENDNLLIVEDAMAARNSIRPGSVMFFGKSNKRYKNMTIEQLTDKDNNYTPNGIIGHIAVVTSVKTDENNNVIEYTMMHGRNPKRHASRTGSKAVQSKRTKGLPPFGNWSQQWVAVANIVTPNK